MLFESAYQQPKHFSPINNYYIFSKILTENFDFLLEIFSSI